MKEEVAIIGAGRWGRNIIKTLSKVATLRAIADSGNSETQTYLKMEYPDVLLTTDYRTLLSDPPLQYVFIATPITTHTDIAREALTAGKHVFVEKPLALETEVIDELYTLAEKMNLTLFTGYIYTYDPAFLALKEELCTVDSFAVETVWTKYGTFDSPLSENLLVHEIALAHNLLGTLEVQEIARNEENVFDGTFAGERGTAHIFIDREQQEKTKVLTVRTASMLYTMTIGKLVAQNLTTKEEKVIHENEGIQLLEIELQNFLEETKNGARANSKRRSMDCSIAAALGQLTSV